MSRSSKGIRQMVENSRESSTNGRTQVKQLNLNPLAQSSNRTVNGIVSSITSNTNTMSNTGKAVMGGTKPPGILRSNSQVGQKQK